MSNSKQSSIEFLEDFLLQHCNPIICDIEWSDFKIAIQEAKEMRKKESIELIQDLIQNVNYHKISEEVAENYFNQFNNK